MHVYYGCVCAFAPQVLTGPHAAAQDACSSTITYLGSRFRLLRCDAEPGKSEIVDLAFACRQWGPLEKLGLPSIPNPYVLSLDELLTNA